MVSRLANSCAMTDWLHVACAALYALISASVVGKLVVRAWRRSTQRLLGRGLMVLCGRPLRCTYSSFERFYAVSPAWAGPTIASSPRLYLAVFVRNAWLAEI